MKKSCRYSKNNCIFAFLKTDNHEAFIYFKSPNAICFIY